MDLLDAVRRQAWDSRFYDLPAEAKAVPTMLTGEEGKMLCWLGEHYFQGRGAVIDLGCFLGGSTVRLASGLQRSGRPWTMHSYDRFGIGEEHKEKWLYAAGYEKFEGRDMRHVFDKHVAPFAPNVIAHPGNLQLHPWTGGPVEILFVDIAKSVSTHHFILDQFFPSLIPKHSIIVQQDYMFFQTPWLITAMELLHPKIELVSWAQNNSALFICNEAINESDLQRIRYDRLSQSEVERLFLRAWDRFPYEWQREMLAVALDSYRLTPESQADGDFRWLDMKAPPSLGPWSEPVAAEPELSARTPSPGIWSIVLDRLKRSRNASQQKR